jgi:hypothetical protein
MGIQQLTSATLALLEVHLILFFTGGGEKDGHANKPSHNQDFLEKSIYDKSRFKLRPCAHGAKISYTTSLAGQKMQQFWQSLAAKRRFLE